MEEISTVRMERLKMLENRNWLDTNFDEIQPEYADRWIAVLDQKIAASHDDVGKVREAVGKRIGEAIIMRIPKQAIPQPM